jgi:hypothetical protein
MDVNRVAIESIAACFLVGAFSQLARAFYHTSQVNFLAYYFLRLLACAVIVAAIYYLKTGRDIGEFTLVIFAALIGLWMQN